MEEGNKHFPRPHDQKRKKKKKKEKRKVRNYSGSLTLSSVPCIIESIMAHLVASLWTFF